MRALPQRGGDGIRFSVTTNGSLLNEAILEFLAHHEFSVELSFDGLAQDISRKKGSSRFLLSVIPRILSEPRLSLETNSVFSSETVGYLSESIKLLVRLGVPKLDINFAHTSPWTSATLDRLEEEIALVGEFFLARFEDLRDVPWSDFCAASGKAVHCCPAGVDRMAVSAQGEIWGCAIFPHYLRDRYGSSPCQEYCFGDIDTFAGNPREVYARRIGLYSGLRMDRFSTSETLCSMCDEMKSCWICPLAAGLTTGEIGGIAAASCQRARILRKGKQRFLDRFCDRGGQSSAS